MHKECQTEIRGSGEMVDAATSPANIWVEVFPVAVVNTVDSSTQCSVLPGCNLRSEALQAIDECLNFNISHWNVGDEHDTFGADYIHLMSSEQLELNIKAFIHTLDWIVLYKDHAPRSKLQALMKLTIAKVDVCLGEVKRRKVGAVSEPSGSK